jgi:hypothetical protein
MKKSPPPFLSKKPEKPAPGEKKSAPKPFPPKKGKK